MLGSSDAEIDSVGEIFELNADKMNLGATSTTSLQELPGFTPPPSLNVPSGLVDGCVVDVLDAAPDVGLLTLLKVQAPPSNNVIRVGSIETDILKQIITCRTRIETVLNESKEGFSLLEAEVGFAGRLIYKQRNQFRNDPGYKALQMLRKSVEKMVANYSGNYLTNLVSLLPQFLPSSSTQTSTTYLPPVGLAQHAGLRAWLTHHGMGRVLHCCRQVALHALQRLHLSHIWEAAMIRIAIASRMWIIVSDLQKKMLTVLESLWTMSSFIPVGTGVYSEDVLQKIFLVCSQRVENAELPSNQSTLSSTTYQFTSNPTASVNSSDYGVKIKRESNLIQPKTPKADAGVKIKRKNDIPISSASKLSGDINGSKIKRVSTTSNSMDGKVKPQNTKLTSKLKKGSTSAERKPVDVSFLSDIHSYDELKSFLDAESGHRKTSRKTSKSRNLSQDEWKALKMEVLASFRPKLPNKSIKLCRKLIKAALLQ